MDTDSQNINQVYQGAYKERKFENDKSSSDKLDCTYRFGVTDSHIKMEIDDNKEYLWNEFSHSKSIGNSNPSIATGLQNMSQQIKCKEERLENDKSRFEIVEQIDCFGNTNSNSQNSVNLHKNLDTELRNIKKEVEVKKDRSGSLHSNFENSTDKLLIFANTVSSFQDRKHDKFIDMINIKQELQDPQYQISELENQNDAQDVKYDPSCEDMLGTEKSDLEAGNSNLQNCDIGFENRFIKIECSDLKTENGYISVHLSGDTTLTHSDIVPHVDTMLTHFKTHPDVSTMLSGTDAHDDVGTLLTPSEVTSKCHMGAVLTPSESPPHVVGKLTKSDDNLDTFKCNLCDRKFKYSSFLKKHMFSHSTERPHQCNVCDKGFKTADCLTDHMISHSTERPHQCDVCDKGFKTLRNLRNHVATHGTVRPHQCNRCDKRFTLMYMLKNHMVSHSTEQPHKCNLCNKRCKRITDLRKHMVSHSTERPHQCNMCDKRFKTISVLRKHICKSPILGS